MAKSIKLQNDTYFDSKGIVHNKQILNEFIEPQKISITLSDNISSGNICCWKIGKIVLVEVSDVKIKEDKLEWATELASGLPLTANYSGGWVKGLLFNNAGVIQMNSRSLLVSERSGTQYASSRYNGQLIYITSE